MVRSLVASTLAMLLAQLAARGQLLTLPAPDTDPPRPHYGLFASFDFNIHSSSFQEFRDCPNCAQRFTGGTGAGYAVGLLYEEPITRAFSAGLRAAYSSDGATLSTIEKTTVILDGQEVEGEFEHRIVADLRTIGIEPLVGYRPNTMLAIYAGGRFGFRMIQNFEQTEVLIAPKGRGAFDNGSRTRSLYSGKIPGARHLTGSVLLGASLEMPLRKDRALLLAPELFLSVGLSSVWTDSIWRTSALRLGVALTYAPERGDGPGIADGLPAMLPPLSGSLSAIGIAADGARRPEIGMKVEEFVSTSMRPLLNYIFFEEGSPEIPQRYIPDGPGQAATFTIGALHDIPALGTYHRLLDIVGLRLRESRSGGITIVGCAADAGREKGSPDLARARAERVRSYLRDIWGIADERMKVEARGLPEKPSSSDDADGIAENRRVEIHADDPAILAPVVTDDTLRLSDPPTVRFLPVVRGAPLAAWTLTVSGNGHLLKEFTGAGPLPERIDWHVGEESANILRSSGFVMYVLEGSDSAGRTITASGVMPVEQVTIRKKRRERIADREIDRYSLILFDFDRSDLSEANMRIIADIRGRIRPGGSVTVEGSTDRTGDSLYNRHLSESRAAATARALGLSGIAVKGGGESSMHDNDLPEGRFYSRTVTIVAESPVEK